MVALGKIRGILVRALSRSSHNPSPAEWKQPARRVSQPNNRPPLSVGSSNQSAQRSPVVQSERRDFNGFKSQDLWGHDTCNLIKHTYVTYSPNFRQSADADSPSNPWAVVATACPGLVLPKELCAGSFDGMWVTSRPNLT